MNSEKIAIRILAATAAVLLLALVFLPRPVTAQVAVKDGDYMVATFQAANGNDALYVADTRAGAIAVFSFDPAARGIRPRAVRPIGDAFMQH